MHTSGFESPGRAERGPPGQELKRLLALANVPEDELDPFTVLGVEVHATEAELKKAYRQLAVQVCKLKNTIQTLLLIGSDVWMTNKFVSLHTQTFFFSFGLF